MRKKVYAWGLSLILVIGSFPAFLLLHQPASAAGPWYVTPSGDDISSCSDTDHPCATINGALAKASSGDMIFVASGTYTGSGNEVVRIDKNIIISGGWQASFTTPSGTSIIDG